MPAGFRGTGNNVLRLSLTHRGCEEMRLKISGFTAPFDFSVKFFK
jgi:hypothetical protein